jgi:hypothetical protein
MERTAATPAAASMGVNADEAHDNSPPEHAAHIFRQATPLDPGEAPVGCLPRLSPAGSHRFHGAVRSLLTHSRCHGAGDRQDEGSGPGCKGIILTPRHDDRRGGFDGRPARVARSGKAGTDERRGSPLADQESGRLRPSGLFGLYRSSALRSSGHLPAVRPVVY